MQRTRQLQRPSTAPEVRSPEVVKVHNPEAMSALWGDVDDEPVKKSRPKGGRRAVANDATAKPPSKGSRRQAAKEDLAASGKVTPTTTDPADWLAVL
jgi:hypothetical protein